MDGAGEHVVSLAATERRQRVVLFDFDGVLMRGDAFSRFVRSRLLRSWWRLAIAVLALPILLPVFGVRSMHMPIAGVFVRISLLGISAGRYRDLADAFAVELVQRPRIFIREGIRTLRRHLFAGDRVIIVTGCEETLVRAIFDAIGLRDLEIVASRLQGGRLGMRKDVHNIGSQKPVQLAAMGVNAPWDIAYSDSSRDIPMLKGACEAILVNAGESTTRRVERALGQSLRKVGWS